MLDLSGYESITEYREIEKTIEIVVEIGGETQTIRIDAVKFERDGAIKYDVRGWVLEDVTLQPTYSKTGSDFDQQPQRMRVWCSYSISRVDADSADAALAQAVMFVAS